MTDFLYTPNREQVVTSNAWAFCHWVRVARGVDLADWAALQRWSATDPVAFCAAIVAFARLPEGPLRLAQCGGRVVVMGDELRHPLPSPPGRDIPADVADLINRDWSPALLVGSVAEVLLHADLRSDDRLLVVGNSAWPWAVALLEGTTLILADATPATLLAVAGAAEASVLVAPAQMLAEAAFQRARQRSNLGHLRTIIATGGPLSPEGRTRIYTWIKPDLMLLARTGDTFWGNPLEPVYARPAATPAFFTPPASGPATW